MAERRMFAKTIIDSDAFLDMPLSARCLYFTLGMLADDDGFVNSPKSIMRQAGASMDDMNILLSKRFILAFDSGVIVIKHWRIHNYIQKDRYKESKYLEEKSKIKIDQNGAYTECIQDVYSMDTQVRLELGKDSLELGEDNTTPPAMPSDAVLNEFEELWDEYPRKEGKKAALASYRRAKKKGVTFGVVHQGIVKYLDYIRIKKIEPKYIKQGSTWFNGECWNDEYDYSSPTSSSQSHQTSSNLFFDMLQNGE